ncbi:hypothetical protein CORC01_14170 [Colletotrichum orchidophilum]|uniref:Uncharacterized protein n=1 Tax=Colletotrichum orchidophilum TaxID=1209926 RepID=A0A1G4AN31_9PEZI|nr:uncharacterized protein CORC01_14170 [Colletotrichum orchidophilum]OHE90531.1 hypothetical protein CORC01_14170 [Colletotrichum orchidophilum]
MAHVCKYTHENGCRLNEIRSLIQTLGRICVGDKDVELWESQQHQLRQILITPCPFNMHISLFKSCCSEGAEEPILMFAVTEKCSASMLEYLLQNMEFDHDVPGHRIKDFSEHIFDLIFQRLWVDECENEGLSLDGKRCIEMLLRSWTGNHYTKTCFRGKEHRLLWTICGRAASVKHKFRMGGKLYERSIHINALVELVECIIDIYHEHNDQDVALPPGFWLEVARALWSHNGASTGTMDRVTPVTCKLLDLEASIKMPDATLPTFSPLMGQSCGNPAQWLAQCIIRLNPKDLGLSRLAKAPPETLVEDLKIRGDNVRRLQQAIKSFQTSLSRSRHRCSFHGPQASRKGKANEIAVPQQAKPQQVKPQQAMQNNGMYQNSRFQDEVQQVMSQQYIYQQNMRKYNPGGGQARSTMPLQHFNQPFPSNPLENQCSLAQKSSPNPTVASVSSLGSDSSPSDPSDLSELLELSNEKLLSRLDEALLDSAHPYIDPSLGSEGEEGNYGDAAF